jgi:hypothetical protein
MSESLERLARNQSLFREINERIEAIASGNGVRILYRLRAGWNEREDAPPGALKAIEQLIGDYEQERPDAPS